MRALVCALAVWAGCAAGDPCDGLDGTCIALTADGTFAVDELDVTLSGATQGKNSLTFDHRPLPLSIALHINHPVGGTITVAVRARSGNALGGSGTAHVTVKNGQHVDVHVALQAPGGPGLDGGADLGRDLATPPIDLGCVGAQCPPVIVASGQAASGVAVDAQNIYWGTTGGSLMAEPRTGGASRLVASSSELNGPMALSNGVLYGASTIASRLWSIPVGGGAPTTLASVTSPNGIAVDGNNPPNVYFSSASSGNCIQRITPPSAVLTPVVSGRCGATGVALSQATSQLFYTTSNAVEVLQLGSGGSASTIVSTTFPPAAIAVDDATRSVYWADSRDGSITRAGFDGSNLTTIYGGGSLMPNALAVDDTSVYWTSTSVSGVYQLPK